MTTQLPRHRLAADYSPATLFFFLMFVLFIYLVMPDLSCGMRDL